MNAENAVTPEVSYATLYPRLWGSAAFNHPRSFWDDSYGLPLNSHPAGKIVVFGLPKSGNVWIKSLLVDGLKLAPVEPLLDVDKAGVGITHRPFDAHIGNRADFLHGVVIIRDLRDVVASYFKYSQTNRFRSARPEFHFDTVHSFYYDWFLSRVVSAHNLAAHSAEFAALGIPVVRYEALRSNPLRELERLMLRWGIAYDIQQLEEAIAANDIDKLRREGKALEKKIDPEHFRRGGVGTYHDDLPADIIADIETRFSDVLRRWGYAVTG